MALPPPGAKRPSGQLPSFETPFAAAGTEGTLTDRRSGRHSTSHAQLGLDERQVSPTGDSQHRPSPRQLPIGPLGLDGTKSHHRHRHSRSREHWRPRPMSHLASSASARGLLPTWSGGKEKDREGDDGLLRPITRETSRSHGGSDSASALGAGSRKSSVPDISEPRERLVPIGRQEIRCQADLERVKKRRKEGEEYLRSALSSIGTLATDITRRLDYTYYNLLEKITALNTTIASFQELSDSASTLLHDFERETAGLDQEIRKQISDLKGFEPQVMKAGGLEERMKMGRQRVQDLGKRLDAIRHEIDSWERREMDWQARMSRRLRIFWAVVTSALLVLILALVLQHWPAFRPPDGADLTALANRSSPVPPLQSDAWESILDLTGQEDEAGPSRYPSGLANRRESLEQARPSSTTATPHGSWPGTAAVPTGHDPLRVFDEL